MVGLWLLWEGKTHHPQARPCIGPGFTAHPQPPASEGCFLSVVGAPCTAWPGSVWWSLLWDECSVGVFAVPTIATVVLLV